MNWAGWQAAGPCSSGPSSGARALREFMLGRYPEAHDGGIYNCRTVRGTTSPSMHGEGRAWDMMLPVRNGRGHPRGHEAVRELGEHGALLGIQTAIFDRTIWSSRSPSGRQYTGVHPHFDHVHYELTRDAARTLTVAKLRLVSAGSAAAAVAPTLRPTLRQGATGEQVRVLQRNLGGLAADGVFGPKTTESVKRFQRSRRLKVDGIVGRQTWAALGL